MIDRSFLWLPALVAAAFVSSSARAESPEPRVVLEAGAGVASFQQASGSSPLCCAERDDWSVLGPEAHAGIGYRVKPWFLPSLNVGFGYLQGKGSTSDRDLDITLRTLRLSPTFAFPIVLTDRFFVEPRLALHLMTASGSFQSDYLPAPQRKTDESSRYFGAGAGLAIGTTLTARVSLVLAGNLGVVLGPGDLNGFRTGSLSIRYGL
jgi:hypothetical protein